jgi:haloacetate dehalogenase
MFFEGFELEHVDVGDAVLRVRHGGEGDPVVLLHGHPRTHTTWHRVAPLLARDHTVVCPDLRGYGESRGPDPSDLTAYTGRAMAGDIAALMRRLGHERFAVAGHDRGCYVAFRVALDHPDAVTRLAVLDGIPIVEALDRADARFATEWWHWFFFHQTRHPAEDLINRDPDEWYGPGDPEAMGEENHADWLRATRDPETVRAMVADYRAGIAIDRVNDERDRDAGKTIACPTLFAFSAYDDMEKLYGDPVAIWREWAPDVTGARIESGHHMAEEAPEQLAGVLAEFLAPARV